MRQDGASFPTLDAGRYLNVYDQALRAPADIRPTVPDSDRVEPVRCPWRRFFARAMDLTLVSLVIHLILALGFRANLSNLGSLAKWLLGLMSWLVLIPLEAFFLSRWGTTPGKWLLCIRLEHADGRLLTFWEAAGRAVQVFSRGEGFTLPFYELYRLWKSYKAVTEGDGVEWDEDVTVIISDLRWWHPVRYIAAEAAWFLIMLVFVFLIPAMPINRGNDLTVAEFVENFNYLAKYHDVDQMYLLQEDGTFARVPGYNYGIEIELPKYEESVFQFEEENGVLAAVSYTRDVSSFGWGYSADSLFSNFFRLSAMSLVWAGNDMFTSIKTGEFLDDMVVLRDGDTKTEYLLGYRLTCSVEDHGDTPDASGAFTKRNLTYSFRITPIP